MDENRIIPYIEPIYRFCCKRLSSRQDAEDLSSEIICHILDGMKKYKIESQFIIYGFYIKGLKVEEIAKVKMPDLNCKDLDGAVKNIEGTARGRYNFRCLRQRLLLC